MDKRVLALRHTFRRTRLSVRLALFTALSTAGAVAISYVVLSAKLGSSPTLRHDVLVYGTLAVVLSGLGALITARMLVSPLERRNTVFAADNAELVEEIEVIGRVDRTLRQSELEIRQAQKLEAVGALAGGIAHDFNNLLTVISGFTQIAVSSLGRDHPVTDDLREVADAAKRAATLTHQLLAFSRKQVLQPRILDLETVVSAMAAMLRRLVGAPVELCIAHSGAPARVCADPGQLEQVLYNLAVNARDAMPHGGTLTIFTGHQRDRDGGTRVVLRVTDTGTGMPADVRDRVFDPFFTTKGPGNTGLGLSTVYGIVMQSGGAIRVESRVGAGSTFVLTFAAAEGAELGDDSSDDEHLLVRGTGTVLLVEDENIIRSLVQRTLEECGYTVFSASDGAEALALAETTPHADVVLSDVMMPHMSGPQLLERYVERFPKPITIYMTGHVDESIMALELDAEVTLLRKPFTPSVLARIVRGALDQRGAPLRRTQPSAPTPRAAAREAGTATP